MLKNAEQNLAAGIRLMPRQTGRGFFRPVVAALLCLALFFAPVFPALADAVVTSNADSGPGSLRQAISDTTTTDQTITFTLGASSTIGLQSVLTLTSAQDNLTIDGDNGGLGVTLDGQNTTRIFNLTVYDNRHLTLNSLTLQNVYDSGPGGGAIYSASDLTINSGAGGVTFSNNSVASFGGAIYAWGNLTINGGAGGVTFSNNRAEIIGGAIYAVDTLTINSGAGGVTFSNNSAKRDGGAIFAGSDTTINGGAGGVTFSNNAVETRGGAIYAEGDLTLGANVIFEKNTAMHGGAIHSRGSLTVGNNVSFVENSGSSTGGAIHMDRSGKLTMGANVNFGRDGVPGSGNNASVAGAIHSNNTTIIDATAGHVGFYHNTASEGGGAIASYGALTIESGAGGVTFSNNSADTYGGAIHAWENLTINSGAGGVTFSNNSAGTYGGAIFAGGNLTLHTGATGDIHFSGNTVNGEANAIYMSNGALALSGGANIIFDDPIKNWISETDRSLSSSVALAQFAGASTLSGTTDGGQATISGGEFRVLSGASFNTGGINTTASFTLAKDATLSGAGSVISPGEIRLAGTVAPTSQRYGYGASETVATGGSTSGSAIGTLTLVGTVVLDGATLTIDTAAGNLSDKLSITGSISSAAVNSVSLNSFHTGAYTIMEWTDTGFNDTTAFSLSGNTFSSRQMANLSIDGKSLLLTLSGDALNLTWNGSSGGAWNSGVEANTVWKRVDNVETHFINGDSVTFTATGAGSIAVDPGGVTAGAMKVTANGYSFSGGPITGDTLSLEVAGPSSTTFSNAINFSSGISVAADNTLVFNYATNVTNANAISGAGSLVKNGAGTLTLTGDNAYAGGITVNAGLINFSSLNNFGTGNITLNGGGLQWAVATSTDISPRLNAIGAGGATFDTNGNDVTLAMGLSGGGLTKAGAGVLTLAGANTYSGPTTIGAGGGLTVSGSLGGGTYAGAITNSGTLTFDQADAQTLSGAVSGAGALVKSGAGGLTLADGLNRTAASAAEAGDLSLNSGVLTIAGQGNHAKEVTVGDGAKLSLTAGGGTALYASSLTFGATGGLDINGTAANGVLLIRTTNGVSGFDPAGVTVAGAGNVDYLSLTAALQNGGRDVEITSALTWNLTNGDQHGTFTLDGEPFTLAQPLEDKAANGLTNWDGKELTKKGAGTLILTADNSYTGDTIIEAGTLQIGDGGSGSGSLGKGNYGGNIANSGTLIFNQATAQTLSGVISGNGGLVKRGEGVLTLSNNASDYSGGTTLAGGTLRLTSGGATGTGNVAIAAGTALELDFSGLYGNTVSGGGELRADAGPGNTLTLGGINDYSGMTTVRSGALELGGDLASSDSLTLHSGTAFRRNGHAHALDSGTLTVWDKAAYDGDLSAQGATMNFIATGQVTDAMLTVAGTANVAGASVNLGASGAITFADGARLPLLEARGGLVGANTATPGDGSGVIKAGATVRYTIGLDYAGNTMYGIVGGSAAEPGAKALAEGYLGGVALTLQGGDLAAEEGLRAARRAARAGMERGEQRLAAFGAGSAGSLRYNTGSHVDMHSVSAIAGLSYGAATPWGTLTAGAFFEYGNGSYDTHNSFSNAASVNGDGHSRYMGGGILGHMDFVDIGPGHMYAEASARTGTLHNRYDSSDLRDASGRKADYSTSSPYYALHMGMGYIWNITEKASLDLYGKYLWTRQEGDSATLSTGESVRFKAVDSHRLRAGSRFAYEINEFVSSYVGASLEHEFDGEARAATNGNRIDAPDLTGDTGIGELGLTFRPGHNLPLFLDLGVQGYVGRREGVTGSLQFRWEF